MRKTIKAKDWELYKEETLKKVVPILAELGFALDLKQPHTLGERYLMQALTTSGGIKLILLGYRKIDNLKVVIKTTNERNAIAELEEEHSNRKILNKINFASSIFHSPKEIYLKEQSGYLFSIQEYIEQDSTFLERPIEEQFSFALSSFKAQEGAHAATYGHMKTIKKTFSVFSGENYLVNYLRFIDSNKENKVRSILEKAVEKLKENRETIEQYCGFLVHTDFVPHNIRIRNKKLYLLDHSSIRFGNKYEGWARFLNFMALYNSTLEEMLTTYVFNNRTKEEHLSLKLMRIYRLGEIISYYSDKLNKSEGDLLKLNGARINFWSEVLKATLDDRFVEQKIVNEYVKTRDTLRSPEEKIRQKDLH